MNNLEFRRRADALKVWVKQCKQAMDMRWPEIIFDGQVWPLKTNYQTKLLDVRFKPILKDFAGQDDSYILVYRCLIATKAFEAKAKTWEREQIAWRLLKGVNVPLAALRRDQLVKLERSVLQKCEPRSAAGYLTHLKLLGRLLDVAAAKGVAPSLSWSPSADTCEALNHLQRQHRKTFEKTKAIDILDRKVEALSDATDAMLKGDPRLNEDDRSSIAVMNILMCAPARINEPLCLRVDDRYTIEDYAKRPVADKPSELFQAHQLLLSQGSKGADWTGKPILRFMVDLVDACWQVILDAGKRSRMLCEYYESHPNRLYLPPDLEHLRGNPVSRVAFAQIVNLTSRELSGRSSLWQKAASSITQTGSIPTVKVPDPRTGMEGGKKRRDILALPWQDVESYLLQRVHERMKQMRQVTTKIAYEGSLSDMLMLVDRRCTPFLPSAWASSVLRLRFKNQRNLRRQGHNYSVFAKLGLNMRVHGKLVECSMEPHDTRRWLTTKALQSRERLSDVLINKWANRLDLGQLSAYDLRTEEEKAQQSAMPVPPSLQALSEGLTELQSLGQTIDLKTEFVRALGNDLVITDLQAIEQCVESTPPARCGSEIVILTPTRFGVCMHQHHKTPCLSYRNCDRCSLLAVCKGHEPSNDAWRERQARTNAVILSEVERHIKTHKREIADDICGLESHILTLTGGLNAETMTRDLIDRFQVIKDQIHDLNFKRRLEQAYTAQNIVRFLDDPDVPDGSLIRYNNQAIHDAPGHERAMESRLGTREERERQMRVFYEEHPEFAPRPLRLSDESTLLLGMGEETNEETEDYDEHSI